MNLAVYEISEEVEPAEQLRVQYCSEGPCFIVLSARMVFGMKNAEDPSHSSSIECSQTQGAKP